MLEAASTKQQLTRALVRHALQTLPHGFDALDTNLIFHASLVSDAYDKWYRVFAQAVRVRIFPATLQCSLVHVRQCPSCSLLTFLSTSGNLPGKTRFVCCSRPIMARDSGLACR